MSGDLIDALFQKAAETYESARRWHLLLVLILLAFQAMLLVPYIGAARQEAATKADIDRSAVLQLTIDDVITDLGSFEKASVDAADAELRSILDQLVARFDVLNGILGRLQQMTPEEAAGPPGEALFGRAISGVAIQMPMAQMTLPGQLPPPGQTVSPAQMTLPGQLLPPGQAVSPAQMPGPAAYLPLPPMSSELRRQLVAATAAGNRDALLKAIAPYVETTIVQPIFARFESEWREQALTQIRAAWQTADARLRQAKVQIPERAEVWSGTETALSKALQSAESLALSEPADRFWWSTRMEKGTTIRDALADLQRARGLADLPALASLKAETAAAVSAERTKYAELQTRLAELREQFKEQEAELSSIAGPLKVVAIDLGRVAAWFPLILGLALGGSWAWMAERARELERSLSLFGDGAEKQTLARWVASKIGRANPATLALRGVTFLIWIAIAALEAANLPGVGALNAASGAAIGAAAVIAAAGFHWRITGRLVS
jgi:hypothetical protein